MNCRNDIIIAFNSLLEAMKKLDFKDRQEWRAWLSENHDKEPKGIWVIYYKGNTSSSSLTYDESVEEALCFGWIDSVIKKIDEEKYCRKFTPRRKGSNWSALNKKRIRKMIEAGLMTEHGLSKIEEAKKDGTWDVDSTPQVGLEISETLVLAFEEHEQARLFFETLATTERKRYIWWVSSAKRPETKAKRLEESIELLSSGQKLGLR